MTAGSRARVAGILYLITFASSIPALALEHPALRHADFILSTGSDWRLTLGGLLDLLNAVAAVGTAVVLYPVLARRHHSLALGFVASRLVEATTIVTSVTAILSLVTMHRTATGASEVDKASVVTIAQSLIAVHDWTFLLGPGLIPGINALLLGTILYRTRLVPRAIPAIGLVGAPLLLASAAATLFGAYDQTSTQAALAALPIATWELALGLWMTVKGFRQGADTASAR